MENITTKDKIYLSIIGGLLFIVFMLGKGLVITASNKSVTVQVPATMSPGTYEISDNTASDAAFRMWAKVFVTDIANFSKDNINQKVEDISRFLAPEKSTFNRAKLLETAEFVQRNIITQEFKLKDIKSESLENGITRVKAFGSIVRYIGTAKDPLSGSDYIYTFDLTVKNGQMLINDMFIETAGAGKDATVDKKLTENKYVNHAEAKVNQPKTLEEAKAELNGSLQQLPSPQGAKK